MEFITLEIRSRLQSCNVFIAMQKTLSLKNLQIKLLENSIMLLLEDRNINFLLPFVKIIPASMSMLNVKNNWICFRLQTMPLESKFGSFNIEVITDLNECVQSTTSSQSTLKDILVHNKLECIILCTCCKNGISKPIIFERILPFPQTDNMDEWFCCKHSSNIVTNNIEWKESDYLYGSCFSVLHKNIFENSLHTDNKTLTCNKCLLHIGMLHNMHNLFKIWNCSVDYKLVSNTTVNATSPLDDFLILVKESLGEVLGEEIILQTSVGKQTHYLLIKPMECKLHLITEPYNGVINDIDTITLQQKSVAKVLYKYDTTSKIKYNTIAVTNFSNVKYHDVSLPIIEAGLKHLSSSTERLPYIYRTVTDYFLGYIVLQEIAN